MGLFNNKNKKFSVSNLFVKLDDNKYLQNMKTMSATIAMLVTTMQQMETEYHEALDHIKELEAKIEKTEAARG